jgi:hypothetical protein
MRRQSWRSPAAGDVDPLVKTTALLAFHINDISVTFAAATNAVFPGRIRCGPVLVFFYTLLFIFSGLFQERYPRELASWCIGGTVLNSRMSIAEVPEVMDILWT